MDWQALLYRHLARYPGMQPEDCIKLMYQNQLGGGHYFDNEALFRQLLADEMQLPQLAAQGTQPPDEVGNGLCRMHLSQTSQVAASTLTALCKRAAAASPGSMQELRQILMALCNWQGARWLGYPPGQLSSVIDTYLAKDCPPIGHSVRFKELYDLHYRILDTTGAFYLPVFAAIDSAAAQRPHILVGIDGMSGAGKSALCELLQQVYACGAVHADDFFLQPEQRTPARLAQAGGNIDYERLAPVAAKAAEGIAFSYAKYDCGIQQLQGVHHVPRANITVLEGVYALHPKVAAACDVRVFLSVDAACQRQRIAARSGPELAKRFSAEWIPMENYYFNAFDIRESCQVILDTSDL